MGFDHDLSEKALRKGKNDITIALDWLNENS